MWSQGRTGDTGVVDRSQLLSWVATGESEAQEFKATTGQRTDAAKTLSAMLNQRGGRVLFGVKPDGAVKGQEVSDKTLEDLAAALRDIEPSESPSIDRVPIDDRHQVIVVTVTQGPRRPYSYRGRFYRRVGATTVNVGPVGCDEYNRLLMEELHSRTRWETEPAEGWTVEDLDAAEIVRTLEEAVRRGRSDEPGTRDPQAILRGLGLVKDGQLLRAAVVLFGQADRLLPDYPQALLRLARFRGVDRSEFIDNRQYHGNAFDLLLRADRFLRDHLPIAGRIVPGLFERQDDPLYPPAALREALANALCHRDYTIGGGSVSLAIYADRLEVTSTGALHFGLTVDDLYREHDSRPWNPLIAEVFYRRGIIERWGRGTVKMVELSERAGLPRPEIEEAAGTVTVRFRVPPPSEQEALSERQQLVLRCLEINGPSSLNEVQEFLGAQSDIDKRRVREDLQVLKKDGWVDSSGYGRGARWSLRRRPNEPEN